MTPQSIALSLVSHTNVGKTTLARTLLQRDVGEVRDEAHVTHEAERHVMIESPEGDRLELWDTPGFGDSKRLARRLAQQGSPLGWFLSEIWDRFRDRGFWHSQRAVRHVLEQADVVLYLVNASEAPRDCGHLDPELQVLELIGKPVLVLLNQLGPPRGADAEVAEIGRWRNHLAERPVVHEVLALDAFARCWVQEERLLEAIATTLTPTAHTDPARHAAFARLRAAWAARSQSTFEASMRTLAARISRAALDREAIAGSAWVGKFKELIGLFLSGQARPRDHAMQSLATRLDVDIRASTDRLIKLHGLDGRATCVVLVRLAEHYAAQEPLSEGKAAMWGGMLTGALAGLKADLATGGLTLGGGLLVGGLLGALGGAGLAKGVNVVRGVPQPTLAWADTALTELVKSALLGYLAVAHFGRGRGDWTDGEAPAFWQAAIDDVMKERAAGLRDQLQPRAPPGDPAELEDALTDWFKAAAGDLLDRLYPRQGPVAN